MFSPSPIRREFPGEKSPGDGVSGAATKDDGDTHNKDKVIGKLDIDAESDPDETQDMFADSEDEDKKGTTTYYF